MSLIVTGTDTGVGKTIVSALLLLKYHSLGPLYWKPVATGVTRDSDTGTIRRWSDATVLPEAYQFGPPVSPHLAARLAGKRIQSRRILSAYSRHRQDAPLLIEGIGGALVPLDLAGYLFADLARDLRLPVIVVARSTLGTINHTLLTLEALRRRRVAVAGVVLNGPRNRENRRAIERFGKVEVISEVSPLPRLSRPLLQRRARQIDPGGVVARLLA